MSSNTKQIRRNFSKTIPNGARRSPQALVMAFTEGFTADVSRYPTYEDAVVKTKIVSYKGGIRVIVDDISTLYLVTAA